LQQVVPGAQQVPTLVPPFGAVITHAWVSEQQIPPLHTPEQQSLSLAQLLPPVMQQVPSARQVWLDVQQVAPSTPDPSVTVQQLVPGPQQAPMLVPPLDEVIVQAWSAGQHVPPVHTLEQQSISAVQVLPPEVQQVPPVQVCPVWHALPQPPQLLWSVFVSTQVPLQFVWLLGHCAVHTPFWHVSVRLHTLLQAPQFSGSEFVSTHMPLQVVCGGEHAHCPLWHVWPLEQTVPQSPQWLESVLVSTQAPPQQ
jgi:hypothetical protein